MYYIASFCSRQKLKLTCLMYTCIFNVTLEQFMVMCYIFINIEKECEAFIIIKRG